MLGGTANLKSPTLRIPPALAEGGCQVSPSAEIMSRGDEPRDMESKKKLAYSLLCIGLIFVGILHFVFSTLFSYGLRQVSGLLILAGVFGLVILNA
ncbi:MAG: hypothetical protein ACI80F_002357 [Natronomonas sp.]|jgi:hypothetical protein